jgi:hypothetical protein
VFVDGLTAVVMVAAAALQGHVQTRQTAEAASFNADWLATGSHNAGRRAEQVRSGEAGAGWRS